MVVTPDIRMAHAFIAVIYKKNVDNKKQFDKVVNECKLAKATCKPMYAVVEKGVSLGVIANMPWKKMVHFTNDFEIPGIITFIDNEVRAGGLYT